SVLARVSSVLGQGLGRAMGAVTGVAGKLGKALSGLLIFGAVGISAASAASGIGAFLAALAPAAGIVAALPAAVVGLQAAFQTLRLATFGVGEALSAAFGDDSGKYAEALEKLAPAARSAVESVRALRPELSAVQQAVQQSFFKQFAGDISGAVKNLLPLRTQLSGLAGEFGRAASEGLRFAGSQQALAPLRAILEGTRSAASGL
ncbi:hypothetical protein G3I76_69880, partial [Streptomyces sp. SID11233]|nr:hypothetical protein [Streptomyces sp. SID11233]